MAQRWFELKGVRGCGLAVVAGLAEKLNVLRVEAGTAVFDLDLVVADDPMPRPTPLAPGAAVSLDPADQRPPLGR